MGVYAKDVADLVGTSTDESTPLGERLYGAADELDLDSVEEVRDVRGSGGTRHSTGAPLDTRGHRVRED